MTREIKFRAWAGGCWIAVDDMEILPEPTEDRLILESDDYTTYEQFTGLLDKNGTEIYEGDILDCYWLAELGITELDCEHRGVARFDDCAFIADFPKPYKCGVCEEGSYQADNLALTAFSHDEEYSLSFEVIGNIHDNPELLK